MTISERVFELLALRGCHTLQVTPTYLLSGIEAEGNRGRSMEYLVVDKTSRDGMLLEHYHNLSLGEQERLMGYAQAMVEMKSIEGR